MIKHIFPMTLMLASFVLFGCKGGKSNTNLKAQDDSRVIKKCDKFADFTGMAHLEDEPNLTDADAVITYLSAPPRNFLPVSTEAGSVINATQYAAVKNAVDAFVTNQSINTEATKIISIVPFDKTYLGADSETHTGNFIAFPYLERGAPDSTVVSDLSENKTSSGLNESGHFSIHQTINGRVTNTIVSGSVYIITYCLGNSTQNYTALVTIPDNVTSSAPIPLMIFAHGGDGGLAFSEMATLLQANLGKFIVAAPVYPGEPICAVTFTQGTEENNYTRSCVDHNGNVAPPAVAAVGDKSPMLGDVNSLLALQNGIWKLTSGQITSEDKNNPFVDKNSASLIPFYASSSDGIQTVGVADSRGGATLMAAIGRNGILMSLNKVPTNVFTAAAFYYSPSSFLVGQFRFLTQQMMSGSVAPNLNGLPMVPEMKHYFDDYRNAEINSADEENELTKLVGFLAASDISYLAPYINVSMQNWTEKSKAFASAPGSIIFLHGTQDAIVPFTESLIAKSAMDQVFENIYTSNENDGFFSIETAALGSQMFSFQPDSDYYNLSCFPNFSAGSINTDTQKCFGGGYKSTTIFSSNHGSDPSFLTSHLLNPAMQSMNILNSPLSNSQVLFDNELLYGADDTLYKYSTGSVSEQFNYFNSAHAANSPLRGSPFTFAPQAECSIFSKTKNGTCYLYGNLNNYTLPKFPLYNRSMFQDETQGNSAMYTGVWDSAAQNSLLTPTDVLSEWVSVSLLGSNGVLKDFY